MLLTSIIFLPTVGAILVLLMPTRAAVRWMALLFAAATFGISLMLFPAFIGTGAFGASYGEGIRHIVRADWIQSFKIEYYLGVDGLSFPLVILTTFISLLSCLAAFNVTKATKGFFSLFLLLETGMLGVFLSLDFFLFYIFWEVMLLPMYFLIGVWGGPRKEYAAIKFFLYTLAGSVLMLIVLLAFYFIGRDVMARPFDLIEMAANAKFQAAIGGKWILGMKFMPMAFAFLFIGFAIKLPAVPFHTWLPDAHVEAPTPISMILAGVLLKMGGYGLMRVSYPILREAAVSRVFITLLAVIGIVSIVYGAAVAMAQTDFKKLVAYSSVSHMGWVTLGLAVTPISFVAGGGSIAGFNGAMFQMVAHGLSSAMMFFLVGVIYDRAHHRDLNRFGGLALAMPVYFGLAAVGFFAGMGLPGTAGFIGEILVLFGTFDYSVWYAGIAAIGMILTAGYILWTIQRVFLGPARPDNAKFAPMTPREVIVLIPMGVFAIALGIYPKLATMFFQGTLENICALFR